MGGAVSLYSANRWERPGRRCPARLPLEGPRGLVPSLLSRRPSLSAGELGFALPPTVVSFPAGTL